MFLQQPTRQIEEAVQRRIQHAVPVFVGHENHQVVVADAGIVHQHAHIVIGVGVAPRFHRGFHGFRVGYVERQQLRLSAAGGYFVGYQTGSLLVAFIVDNHGQTL